MLNVALTLDGATIPKSVSSRKSSLQLTNAVKTKNNVNNFQEFLIKNENQKLIGYNTDIEGFKSALTKKQLSKKKIFI